MSNTVETRREPNLTIEVLISLFIPTIVAIIVQYPVYEVLKYPFELFVGVSFFFSVMALMGVLIIHYNFDFLDLYKDNKRIFISTFVLSIITVITICTIVNNLLTANLCPATDIFVSINGYEREFKLEDVPLYDMLGANDKVEYIIKYNGDDSFITDNINDIVEDGKIKYRYGNWDRLLSEDEAESAVQDLNKIKGTYSICWKTGLGLIILWRICVFIIVIKKKLAESENADKTKELSETEHDENN